MYLSHHVECCIVCVVCMHRLAHDCVVIPSVQVWLGSCDVFD